MESDDETANRPTACIGAQAATQHEPFTCMDCLYSYVMFGCPSLLIGLCPCVFLYRTVS